MPAASDRETIVAALDAQFDSLVDLGRDLTDAQWETASEVPGWTVKDNFSHIIGTELMLLGRPDADPGIDRPEHVKNDIGAFNEVPVMLRRNKSGAEVLAEFAMVAGERKAALKAMTDEEFDAESFTPAGQDTYGRFMQIRVFDCWIHEQDCREALGMPGNDSGPAAEVMLDEMTTAMGFVVGKKAGATHGQSVSQSSGTPPTRFDWTVLASLRAVPRSRRCWSSSVHRSAGASLRADRAAGFAAGGLTSNDLPRGKWGVGPMVAGGGRCDRRPMHLLASVPSINVLASHDIPDDPWCWLEIYSMWWVLLALLAAGALLIASVVIVPAGMVPALLIARAVVRWRRRRAGEGGSSGFDDDGVAGGDGAGLEDPGVGA